MPSTKRSVFLNAEPECVIALLLRPAFWACLPFRFRPIKCDTPYLSVGAELRPSVEVFRLVAIRSNSLIFRIREASLELSAFPMAGGTALQSEVEPSKEAVSQTVELLNGVAKLLVEEPHLKWLAKMALTTKSTDYEEYVETSASALFESPISAEDLEDQIAGNPLGFPQWLDSFISRGTFSVDPAWPASGALARYSRRRELWWLTPWWSWTTTGEIELLRWERGRRILLQDKTEPCGVTSTWDFHYLPQPGGVRIELEYVNTVRSAVARKLLGGAFAGAAAMETGLALCKLTELMTGSSQAAAVSS